MDELVGRPAIPSMSPKAIDAVRQLEKNVLAQPQVVLTTHHVLHGGMYARTITIPANAVLTGALIEIPTLLIFDGDAEVWLDGEAKHFDGHHVLPASAGRKQAFRTYADTHLTMVFPTSAKTVAEAEEEFTREADRLGSRRDENRVVLTGE